jgi:predicted transcriptional regulator
MLQTHVMFRANLSYSTLKVYLETLVNAGLLKIEFDEESSSKLYSTTARGLKFQEQAHALNELLGENFE